MATKGTLLALAEELIAALQPLSDVVQSESDFSIFMRRLGWNTSVFIAPIVSLGTLVDSLDSYVGDDGLDPYDEEAIFGSLAATFAGVWALSTVSAADLPATIDPADFTANFPGQLLDYLIADHLLNRRTGLGRLLQLVGVIRVSHVAATGKRLDYTRYEIAWSDLANVLNDPTAIFTNAYHWGGSDFDAATLLDAIFQFGLGQGFTVSVDTVTDAESAYLRQGALPALLTPADNEIVRWRFLDSPYLDPPIDVGIGLAKLPETAAAKPGFVVLPFLTADTAISVPLGENLSANFSGQLSFAGGVALQVRPGVAPKVEVGFLSGAAAAASEMSVALRYAGSDGEPIVLLGETDGSRLQANSFTLKGGLRLQSGTNPDAFVEAAVDQGSLIIQPASGEADGFLSSILPQQVSLDLSVTAGLSSRNGIYFEGGGGLEIELPLHIELGPLQLVGAIISIKPDAKGIPVELGASIEGELGPLQASIDNVGLRALLTFPPGGGNLGPADLSLAFMPPKGVGLALDAGAVAGGGFISFDDKKKQYAGILNICLVDVFQVTFIIILDTVLPGGQAGYSLLFLIALDMPLIQLGLGFALKGLGGAGGVNRTISIDALQKGFKDHSLDNLLFPSDPIKNAPQIITTLSNVFPPAQGRYLFGPSLDVTWEDFVDLQVGVFLEVPDPIRVVLIGLAKVYLPGTIDLPEVVQLVVVKIEVLGLLETNKQKFSLDGKMYDSRVLTYSLKGSLALRVSYGQNPNFAFCLGGFHPAFNTTGLDIPPQDRLSIIVGGCLSANSYLALTSNTIQHGSNVDAHLAQFGFDLKGHLGYDALFILSPFSFEFDFTALFNVSYQSISIVGFNLTGTLKGVSPWEIKAQVSISLWLFSVGANIDLVLVPGSPPPLPPSIDVLSVLTGELGDPKNWSATLPAGTTQAITLSTKQQDDNTVLVHPRGTLQVKQKKVPLDLTITRYQNAPPQDYNYFTIPTPGGVQFLNQPAGSQPPSFAPVQDYFAPAQFQDSQHLKDSDALSGHSFESYHAGGTISSADITSGDSVTQTITYQEFYIYDALAPSVSSSQPYQMRSDIYLALAKHGPGFLSPVKNTGSAKYRNGPLTPAVTINQPNYVIAGMNDLKLRSDILSAGLSYYQARAILNQHLAIHPEEAGNLQIVGAHEARP